MQGGDGQHAGSDILQGLQTRLARVPDLTEYSLEEIYMSVLLEFSMVPMDKGDSFSQYVAQTLDVIDRSGVSYRLNPMGTILEGEWDEVLQVVTDCYRKLSEVSDRVSCSIKIDARKGREDRLQGKIKSVEKVLNRELKK